MSESHDDELQEGIDPSGQVIHRPLKRPLSQDNLVARLLGIVEQHGSFASDEARSAVRKAIASEIDEQEAGFRRVEQTAASDTADFFRKLLDKEKDATDIALVNMIELEEQVLSLQDQLAHAKAQAFFASIDKKTGLYRAELGLDLMNKDLDAARATGDLFFVFEIDVNGLKFLNDTAGKAAGDKLLQHAGQALRASFRYGSGAEVTDELRSHGEHHDLLAHYEKPYSETNTTSELSHRNGDEFIGSVRTSDAFGATDIQERLRRAVEIMVELSRGEDGYIDAATGKLIHAETGKLIDTPFDYQPSFTAGVTAVRRRESLDRAFGRAQAYLGAAKKVAGDNPLSVTDAKTGRLVYSPVSTHTDPQGIFGTPTNLDAVRPIKMLSLD